MPTAVDDLVWRGRETTPAKVEAELRRLLIEAHQHDRNVVPTRAINLVCIVDAAFSGEIANRLRGIGRSFASRTIVLSITPRRTQMDATATVTLPAVDEEGGGVDVGGGGPLRETVVVDVGERHLPYAGTIVDAIVATDVPTMVWSPHGHPDAVDALRDIAQIALYDSSDEVDAGDSLGRAIELMDDLYVVDLAWLRSTPWRERLAGAFDAPTWRPELGRIESVRVHHHPTSEAAGLLLLGWLASRLGWRTSKMTRRRSADLLSGRASAPKQEIRLELRPDDAMHVRGLSKVEVRTSGGRELELGRGEGGLRAAETDRRGRRREWTIIGASRGEAGILEEGIRQALLRDPIYRPALLAAETLIG